MVLITRKDPQRLSRAWEAGIVSVVSVDDAPSTVLLAIMAAALRVPKAQAAPVLQVEFPPLVRRPCANIPRNPSFRSETL